MSDESENGGTGAAEIASGLAASGSRRAALSIVGQFAGWAAIAAGAGGSLVLREIRWSWQPAIVATALAPYWAVAALFGGIVLAVVRCWVGVVAAGVVVAAVFAVQAPLFVADRSIAGPRFVFMQANLRVGSADASRVVAAVRRARVEVLTLEELTAGELTRLDAAGLAELLPYRITEPHPDAAGTGLFSRFPLSDPTHDVQFTFAVVSAIVNLPGARPTIVFATHLVAPWPRPSAGWVAELPRFGALLAAAGRSGRPVVVGGDFNATYDEPQYRAMLGPTFRDATEQSGSGFLPTYPTDRFIPPVIGIDHFVVSRAHADDVSTIALPGSDHRGLVATITVPS